MCTIIVATRAYADAPLLIAANRDEALDRPAGPPRRWGRVPEVLAPEDERAGGTWWGLNDRGLFAAITNRFTPNPDPSRLSRGVLVLEALTHASPLKAARALEQLSAHRHNPHHLLLADRREAYLLWNDGESLHLEALDPGVHVITERIHHAAPTERPDRVREAIESWPESRAPRLEEIVPVLASHHPKDPLESVCVHAPHQNYGTRSSTVIRMGPAGDDVSVWHAPGRPCETAFADYRREAAFVADSTTGA